MIGLGSFARAFRRDCRGSSATEFVLILPLLALLIFGTIDAGWFAWRINLAEKATQAGVRMAVATNPVASGLTSESYVGKSGGGVTLKQGDLIPSAALGTVSCTNSTCTCPADGGLTSCARDSAAFTRILTRMQYYDSSIQPANVIVEYRGSGLGYAGDPGGMEIAPTVTVRLTGMQFNAMSGYIWKAAMNLPDFAASLTMEDGEGTNSN